jgi:ribose/xylose/arabinose/galactoside ABC-type transport system permease subunit
VAALAASWAVYGLTNNTFLLPQNFGNIGVAATPIVLVSLGMTMVIVSGGIDLSVGAAAGFASVVSVWLMTNHVASVPVAVLIALGAGAAIGLVNAALVVIARLPDFIATLATMTSLQGLSYIVSGGFTIRANNPQLGSLAGNVGPAVPVPLLIMAGAFLLVLLVMHYTTIGRSFYAIGGGRDIARLAGLQVGRISTAAYVMSGVLAAAAGVIAAARTQAGSPGIGTGWELQAITVVVLGGASLFGGSGSVVGTLLAGLLLASLDNWIGLQAFPAWAGEAVRGLTLIAVVAVTQGQWWKRRAAWRQSTA